jgi:hypothetical protein
MTPDPTADLCTTCQPGPVRFPGPTTRCVLGLVCLPADPTAYLARRVWLLSAGPDFLPRPDQPRRPRSGLPPRPDRPAATSRFWFAFQTGQLSFQAHASRPSGVSLSPSTTPCCGLRPPASIRLRLRRRRWSKIWMNDGLGTGQPARLVASQHRKPTVPLFSQPFASGDLSRAYDVGPHPVSAPVSVGVETQRVRASPGPPPRNRCPVRLAVREEPAPDPVSHTGPDAPGPVSLTGTRLAIAWSPLPWALPKPLKEQAEV